MGAAPFLRVFRVRPWGDRDSDSAMVVCCFPFVSPHFLRTRGGRAKYVSQGRRQCSSLAQGRARGQPIGQSGAREGLPWSSRGVFIWSKIFHCPLSFSTLSWQQSRVVFLYAPPTWRDPAGKALPHESTLGHWCFLMHNLWFLLVVSEPIIREFQLQ